MSLLPRRARSQPLCYRRRSVILRFITLVFLVNAATTFLAARQAAATDPKKRPGASPATATQQTTDASLQPPDGKWLTDEQGRLYFLKRLPKKHAVRIDEQTVRTWGAIPIAVVKEDDDYYYFKVYQTASPTPSVKLHGPTATESKQIAVSYQTTTLSSQQLQATSFSQGLPTSGQWRRGFAIADMNGDGHLDIVHGPARKTLRPPTIFLGDGKGTWTRWQDAQFPALPFDYGDAQVGDLNGDGKPDLVLGVHLRGLLALTQDGQGNFAEARTGIDFAANVKQGSAFSSQAIQLVDWNGDGRLDILALSEGPQLGQTRSSSSSPGTQGVRVYLNNGDGSWTPLLNNGEARPIFGASLTVGDFNGDGRQDFATGSYVQGRKDLINLSKADGNWEILAIDSLRPTALMHSVVAGDFDRDGRDDLAVAYLSYEAEQWRSGIDVFYTRQNGQDGQWQRRALFVEEGQLGAVALGVGDLNGDQHRDLVALTADGRTLLFLNDGVGFFSRDKLKIPTFGNGCRGAHVEVADLDGDGNDDIVASFSSEAQSEESQPEKTSRRAVPVCPTEGGVAAWRVTPRLTAQQTR